MATWSPPQSTVVNAPLLSSSTTAGENKIEQIKVLPDKTASTSDATEGYEDALKVIEDFLADLKDGESPTTGNKDISKQLRKTAECKHIEKEEKEIESTKKEQQSLSPSNNKKGTPIVSIKLKSFPKDSSIPSEATAVQETDNDNNLNESIKVKSSWRNKIGKAAVGFKGRFKKKEQSKDIEDQKEQLQQTQKQTVTEGKEETRKGEDQTSILQKAEDSLRKATNAEAKEDYKRAHLDYMLAKSFFDIALKSKDEPISEDMKETVTAKRDRCLERGMNIRQQLLQEQRSKATISKIRQTPAFPLVQKPKPKFKREGPIILYKPDVKMSDIAGAENAKGVLESSILIPLKFPELYDAKHILKPYKSVLLYGPSGVGKTQLAKALATEMNATFIHVNTFGILSAGIKSTIFTKLFELAHKNKPSVIFIDEIDMSFTGTTQKAERMNQTKNEFIMQIQELLAAGKTQDQYSGIIFIASTTAPWKIEPAVLQKFVKKLYVPLPDEDSRKKLIEIHLGNVSNDLTESDKKELAVRTHLCSGANIEAAIREAMMEPLRICLRAKAFKFAGKVVDDTFKNDFYTPCSPLDTNSTEMIWRDVPHGKLLVGKVSQIDCLKYFALTCSRVSSVELKEFDNFVTDYGEEEIH